MKDYVKYQHVEKLGSDDVDGILFGEVYVFPKIDGTNAHIWEEDGTIHFGSRTREVSIESDNAGFMNWAAANKNIWHDLFYALPPKSHVFGEWLVPHSLKTYRDDAWRNFYLFDIVLENGMHMPYEEYHPLIKDTGVNYIPPLRIIKNPQLENIMRVLDDNNYLIEDGKGIGEGVVLKNYNFVNKYGRQVWAKIVTSEFKEKHHKEMGAPVTSGTAYVEEEIVEHYLTETL
jgi:hypothetical protein